MKNNSQNWMQLSSMQISGALSLPVIMTGYYLGLHYPPLMCLLLIFGGNGLLFLLALFYLKIINHRQMVTIELAQLFMGPLGASLCAIGITINLLGWSALQIHSIVDALGNAIKLTPCLLLIIYLLSRKQLPTLGKVTQYLLPVTLCALLLMLCLQTTTAHPARTLSPLPLHTGLSLVLMVTAGAVFDLPTFFYRAASKKQAIVSISIVFLLAIPLIEGIGVYMANHYLLASDTHWMRAFVNHFNLSSKIFLLISGCIAIALNVYSAGVVINRVTGLSYQNALVLICVVIGGIAFFDCEQFFVGYLEVINAFALLITGMIFVLALRREKNNECNQRK